jgi:hypothetical protein
MEGSQHPTVFKSSNEPESTQLSLDFAQGIQPDERIFVRMRGRLLGKTRASGIVYLTSRRLLIISRQGVLAKRDTPVFEVALDRIVYARITGLLSKSIWFGVSSGTGFIAPFKLRVTNAQAWVAAFRRAKVGVSVPER